MDYCICIDMDYSICIDMVEGYIQPFFIQQAEKKKEIKESHSLLPFIIKAIFSCLYNKSYFLLFVAVNPCFRAPSWQVLFSPPKHSFFESGANDKIGRDTVLD